MLQILDKSKQATFFAEPNTLVPGFSEGGEYWILKPAIESTLYIDDELIHSASDDKYWAWMPGFYAGQVNAEIEIGGNSSPINFYFDVSTHPDKLGRDQFERLLLDVIEYDPNLIYGSEPAQYALGGQQAQDAVWIAYARTKAYFPSYLKSLKAICDRPIQKIKYARQRVPLHRVRNIDPGTAISLGSNRALAGALSKAIDIEYALRIDISLSVPFNETTVDNPANRIILSQAKQVIRKIEWLIFVISNIKDEGSETRTSTASRTDRRIKFLNHSRYTLQRLTKSYPFNLVSGNEVSASGLNAIASHPTYSHAHITGNNILRTGLSTTSDKEFHYLSPTWAIYESWCFSTLATALEANFCEYNWDHTQKGNGSSRAVIGRSEGNYIKLYFQLNAYSNQTINGHEYYSISKMRIPDLVIEVGNDDNVAFICLDAKYRVSKDSLLDAMTSAHIYHDSIRLRDSRSLYSFILSPSDVNAGFMKNKDYIHSHKVGVIKFQSQEDVRQFMFSYVEEAIQRVAMAHSA
jgi:hypothetical protein